jgi:hypothetical protein
VPNCSSRTPAITTKALNTPARDARAIAIEKRRAQHAGDDRELERAATSHDGPLDAA